MASVLELLDRLISFDTTSRNSNIALIDWVAAQLDARGIAYDIVPDASGTKQALLATLPARDGSVSGGVALSGHTDVVPVDGQPWTRATHAMSREDGRVYGRGTTDMKGFVAVALKTVLDAAGADLARPLHLALSYDEEVGCKGIRPLIDHMKQALKVPDVAIIGEPSSLMPMVEHKGKIARTCRVSGDAGHSSYAAAKVNAVIYAARLVAFIDTQSATIARDERPDPAYVAPNSSLHVGRFEGGGALNMIPETAAFQFETRYRPGFDAAGLMARIEAHARLVLEPEMHAKNPQTGFSFEPLIDYPPFQASDAGEALALVTRAGGANARGKVDYGTEAGVFSQYGGIDSIVFGPGSMAQGHQPDEFIEVSELEAAEAALARIVDELKRG
jgi:acetylornithine deacetylase